MKHFDTAYHTGLQRVLSNLYRKARIKPNASVKRAKAAYLTDKARQLADPNCPLANGGV